MKASRRNDSRRSRFAVNDLYAEPASRVQVLLSEAVVEHQAGRLERAKVLYLQILRIDVRNEKSLFGLGVIAYQAGGFEVAEKMIRRVIAIDGKKAIYHARLGLTLQAMKRYGEALTEFEYVLVLNPNDEEAHFNLGTLHLELGELDKARSSFERAITRRPSYAEAHNSLGLVLQNQSRLDEAMLSYRRALDYSPNYFKARWNKALLELLLGNFEQGWKDYEVRHHIREVAPRSCSMPLWRGGPLSGARVLLHAEQGLGDTIQFLRYVPLVQEAGGAVLLNVPKTLFRLAESMPGVIEVTTEDESLPSFDCHCPLMSLPLALGTTATTIPGKVPYLGVPEEARKKADAIPWAIGKFHVGLAWSGNPAYRLDQLRSIPFSKFEPLYSLSGLQFFSIQVGSAASELDSLQNPVVDLQSAIEDMGDTAALISHLDLVITVDTAVAHLAAALGKPTWVLLPFVPDWRWLIGRNDSPWYPTVRLFRQPRPRDWKAVIELVQNELALTAGCNKETSRCGQ